MPTSTSADLLGVMASPRRQAILRLVWSEERRAGDVAAAMPDVSFGAISLQLGALARAGLVDVRADGRNRYYRARPDALGAMRVVLEQMWDSALWRLKLAAELEQSRRGPRPRRRRSTTRPKKP